MKKVAITLAVVLGLGLTSFANPNGGGVFNRGAESERVGSNSGRTSTDYFISPRIPNHGETGHQSAPLGSGIAVLTALGAAYLVGKRRKED